MLFSDSQSRRTTLVSTALAALLAGLVLLPLLGHKPLAEWDEGIYAEVSREMLGGSWLVPHWNYQLWLEKPPLMLWITALFFKLFAVSEFWARAGSAFSGIAIVALLHGWLARRRELLTAWLSTIILLATFGFLHLCHVGEMDTLLSLGCCLSLIGLTQIEEDRSEGWLVFWLGFAIALMTKGAASVVIPIAAIIFAATQRWRLRQFTRAFALGLMLFLLLVLPWHLAMYRLFGHAFLDEYFGLHVLARAAHQIEGHNTHWWFYLVVLLVSAPPFCLLYPASILCGFQLPAVRVWAIFSLVVLAFYSVVQTRLPHYIAPAYPAQALLTAAWLGDWLKPRLASRPRSYWPRVTVAVAAVWTVSILLTHSTLKSLHSADLAGPGLLDNKEADALIRTARYRILPIEGPLLVWRTGPIQSIATIVFYSGRPVQHVQLVAPAEATDRYVFNPEPLEDAVGPEPRLILLDKSLIDRIPAGLTYTPIQSSATVELGTIVHTR